GAPGEPSPFRLTQSRRRSRIGRSAEPVSSRRALESFHVRELPSGKLLVLKIALYSRMCRTASAGFRAYLGRDVRAATRRAHQPCLKWGTMRVMHARLLLGVLPVVFAFQTSCRSASQPNASASGPNSLATTPGASTAIPTP